MQNIRIPYYRPEPALNDQLTAMVAVMIVVAIAWVVKLIIRRLVSEAK